jgi:hypothetical protein
MRREERGERREERGERREERGERREERGERREERGERREERAKREGKRRRKAHSDFPVINGELAAYESPSFKEKLKKTRTLLLKSFAEFSTSI